MSHFAQGAAQEPQRDVHRAAGLMRRIGSDDVRIGGCNLEVMLLACTLSPHNILQSVTCRPTLPRRDGTESDYDYDDIN